MTCRWTDRSIDTGLIYIDIGIHLASKFPDGHQTLAYYINHIALSYGGFLCSNLPNSSPSLCPIIGLIYLIIDVDWMHGISYPLIRAQINTALRTYHRLSPSAANDIRKYFWNDSNNMFQNFHFGIDYEANGKVT